jgi:hypothetical protein
MPETRAQSAAELLRLAKKGPDWSFTFIQLDTGIQLTGEQKMRLEAHVTERYRLWADTWVVPRIEALLKTELNPEPKRPRRPRGMGDLLAGVPPPRSTRIHNRGRFRSKYP